MTDNSSIVLSVQDLKVYFHGEDEIARAVDGMDFEVRRRENVCLVGESGCGKTVSALAIMGLIPCPPAEVSGGRIIFGGNNLLGLDETELERIRGRRIGMVFQEPPDVPEPGPDHRRADRRTPAGSHLHAGL